MNGSANAIDLIRSIFDREAARPFLIDAAAGTAWTYERFKNEATIRAAALRNNGVVRGDRVALLLENSLELATYYFATLFLGAAAMPVNPGLSKPEIEFLIGHAAPRRVLVSAATAHLCPSAQAQITLNVLSMTLVGAITPFEGVGPDDIFSVTFTSGTTSRPKAVAHRIDRLFENAAAFNAATGTGRENRFLHVMPMTYMAGVLNTLVCPFMAGASVVIERPFDARTAIHFWNIVREHTPDTFWLTPTMLAMLTLVDRSADGPATAQKHLRNVFVGTAPLALKVRRDFERKYGVTVLESYGLSELLLLTGNASARPVRDGSVGRFLPGVTARFIGEDGNEAARGAEGEIYIRTPFAMSGYLDYKTLASEPAPEEFPTGDVGRMDVEDNLYITARKKDLIIRGGMNVSPRAVEEVLMEHEAVRQVAVVGLKHDLYGEEVVAVLNLKGGSLESLKASLDAFCKKRLHASAVPTRYVALDEFPTSANGKIQKNRLIERLQA